MQFAHGHHHGNNSSNSSNSSNTGQFNQGQFNQGQFNQGQFNQYNQHFPSQPTTTATHHWEKLTGHLPQNTVFASDAYAVIRADNGHGDMVVGKYNVQQHAAYIPYNGKEVHVTNHIEVLVSAPGAQVQWIPASHGSLPQGAIGPLGQDGLFVGRAVCPQPENKHTPGKIQPGHKCLYMPWGGKEERFDNYEVCVIAVEGPYRWEKLSGSLPYNTVYASDAYAVIRADAGHNDMVVGKYNIQQHAAYIPFNGKEVHVTSNIEVLVAGQGAHVQWVPVSHGVIPQGAIGPVGVDCLYVGRAVCPQPEHKHTPGKIHPAHKCLYMPYGGKEERFDNYEACIIRF